MRPRSGSFFESLWHWGRFTLVLLVCDLLLAWAAAGALIVRSDLVHADAILILAGSSTYLERSSRAAQLFHEGRAQKIILTSDNLQSGWSVDQMRNPLFVERAGDELRRRGVPAEKIEVVPGAVTSTYEEAVGVRQYAAEHGLRSILIVTTAYQSRRALWTFRRVFQGSSVLVGMEPVAPGEQAPRPAIWWYHRLGWELVPGEYFKMFYYWVHYR